MDDVFLSTASAESIYNYILLCTRRKGLFPQSLTVGHDLTATAATQTRCERIFSTRRDSNVKKKNKLTRRIEMMAFPKTNKYYFI